MAKSGQAANDFEKELKKHYRLTIPKARVTQIIDGQTLVINNSKTISLPMLYIPWDSPQNPGENVKKAKEYLEDILKNRFVRIYQVRNQKRGQLNSLGHVQAFVMREDGLWIQHDMVKKGLAFVYPTHEHFENSDILYKAEETARKEKTGLWADPQWAVVSDQDAKTLSNRFAVVEGTIVKVITRKNTIYLNFERDWKTDFTIAIPSKKRREFSKAGVNIMQWGNKTVRVRGWLREYNGPFIEINHPSQIEVIKTKPEIKIKTPNPPPVNPPTAPFAPGVR